MISSDLPGVRKIFDDSCGLFFRASDSTSLAERMSLYITDRDLFNRHAAQTRIRVKKFAWDKVFDRIFSELDNHVQNIKK